MASTRPALGTLLRLVREPRLVGVKVGVGVGIGVRVGAGVGIRIRVRVGVGVRVRLGCLLCPACLLRKR